MFRFGWGWRRKWNTVPVWLLPTAGVCCNTPSSQLSVAFCCIRGWKTFRFKRLPKLGSNEKNQNLAFFCVLNYKPVTNVFPRIFIITTSPLHPYLYICSIPSLQPLLRPPRLSASHLLGSSLKHAVPLFPFSFQIPPPPPCARSPPTPCTPAVASRCAAAASHLASRRRSGGCAARLAAERTG